MSQGEALSNRVAGFERRPRFRFEIARSQLLVAAAALALLACLLFLSGLAIGLLVNPRLTADGSVLQSAVLPRPSTPPPQRQTAEIGRTYEPPKARWRLDRETSFDPEPLTEVAASASMAIEPIVWRPREQRQAMGQEMPRGRGASPTVDPPSVAEPQGVATQRAAMPPAATPDEGTAVLVLAKGGEDEPVFAPRGTSMVVQPPARWRRSQPLAVAFLVAPEDADGVIATESAEEGRSRPGDDGVRSSTASASQTLASEAAESRPTSDVVPTTDNVPRHDATSPSSEDEGWQPSTSHWRDFNQTLGSETAGSETAASLTGTPETVAGSAEEPTPAPGWTESAPNDLAQDGAADPPFAAGVTTEEQTGWQPSSRIWKSFYDAPYDWTTERLPPEPVRTSRASGSTAVPYGDLIDRVAVLHGVEPALVAAMVRVESAFDPLAQSHKGALGLMQVMPATARRFGITEDQLFDPATNLEAGLRYLSWLRKRFDGDTKRMLAAYNAGEAAVDTYGGIPPYAETRNYVERVYQLMGWVDGSASPDH